jgi:glycosyltransferase involved in cell wall biosynthesis
VKILLTTDAFPPRGGGSAQSTAALASALALRGHSVTVVVGRRGSEGESERSENGIRVLEVGLGDPRPGPGRTRRLESPLRSFLSAWAPGESFDLAHAQHLLSAGPTLEAGRRAGFPVIVTVRDYWPVCIWSTRLSGSSVCPGCSYLRRVLCVGRRYPLFWPLAPFAPPVVGREIARRMNLLSAASSVVAVSRFVRDQLPALARVEVIPNLVDLAAIDQALTRALLPGIPVPERFSLFVGKLEPNKAPDVVVPILQSSGVDLPLVVVGTGSYAAAMDGQARRAGIAVRFLGWQEPSVVLLLMARAKALLFPSRWPEPLSRVLLEGLAVGGVLVAGRSGGNPEIVVDGESGLLGSSVEEMGIQLRRACQDEALAGRLREAARRRAVEVFSDRAVLPRMESLYREVVAGRRTP